VHQVSHLKQLVTYTPTPFLPETIHEKDPSLVDRVGGMEAIEGNIADVGQRQFEIFQSMQRVSCLCSERFTAHSALSKLSQNPKLLEGPDGSMLSDQQRVINEAALSLPSTSHASEERGLALRSEFPPRPSEGQPGDQLMLRPESAQYALTWSEAFELYSLYKQDPQTWTIPKLASEFEVPEQWVQVLLQHVWPPTYVEVEGDVYGVYEVRAFNNLR